MLSLLIIAGIIWTLTEMFARTGILTKAAAAVAVPAASYALCAAYFGNGSVIGLIADTLAVLIVVAVAHVLVQKRFV